MFTSAHRRPGLVAWVCVCLLSLIMIPVPVRAEQLEVDSLQPGSGSTAAATPVTLTGSGFAEDLRVALVDGGMVDLGWEESVRRLGHDGATFYGADGQDFVLLRIDSEGHLVETGRTTLSGEPTAIALEGDLAVAVTFDFFRWRRALTVIDVSDRGAPVVVGEMELPSWVHIYSVGVSGSAAAWSDGNALHFVDLADPTQPRERGVAAVRFGSGRLAMSGGLLYGGGFSSGLTVVDYTDLNAPQVVLQDPAYKPWGKVQVSDQRLYFVDVFRGLMIFGLSDPARPELQGSFPGSATGFDVGGDHLAAHTGGRVALFDVSDPAAVVELDAVGGTTAGVESVSLHDGWILQAYYGSVQRFDAHRTRRPSPLFHYQDRSLYRSGMAATEQMLYVVGDEELETWRIDGAEGLTRLGAVATTSRYGDLVVSHDHLYALSGSDPGLAVFDLSDPEAPVLLAKIGEYTGNGLRADGQRLYVVDGKALIILDLADPSHPVEVGRIPAWSVWGNDVVFADVCLDGSDAYIVSGTNDLFKADVSDPAAAHIVWETPQSLGAWPNCCAIVGNHLYVGSRNFVSILELGSPYSSGRLSPIPSTTDLTTRFGQLYLSDAVGLKVFDTSQDPLHPPLRSATDLPGSGEIASAPLDPSRALAVGGFDLAVVRTNPGIEGLQTVSESRAEFTVPAGMNPGPYHVYAQQEGSPERYLGNAFEVVETCPLEASLSSDQDPLSGTLSLPASWALTAEGDERFFEPERRHRAWLELPPLGEDPGLEKKASPGPEETIEIHLGPEGAALVRLTGPDPDSLAERWQSMAERGGIALEADGAHSYRPVELTLERRSGAGQAVVDPEGATEPRKGTTVYRYTLAGGVLVAAAAEGQEVDHLLHLAGRTASGCEAEDVLSVYQETVDACRAFNEENPSWRIDCPAP